MNQSQHTRGVAMLIVIMFFLAASILLIAGIGKGVYEDMVVYRLLEQGKQSYYAAESGVEDAIYRYRNDRQYSNSESLTIGGIPVAVTRTFVVDRYRFVSDANNQNAVRTTEAVIVIGDGVSFEFGLQGGNGGITQSNNSKVYGDVFSNGTVVGAGNATVYGDVVSTEASGYVATIHATGSVWANTIVGSDIEGDAYYQTMIGTLVGGTSYPGSPDQPTAPFPITDALIDNWKMGIATSGTLIASTSAECAGGTYTIQSNVSLGNVRIECNVHIKKQGASTVVTLTGPVWIQGNLEFSSGPTIIASSSLKFLSTAFIVDNESNRTTSSKVKVNQATDFLSGDPQSYILLLSMNNSDELGGSETAMDVLQSVNGKVLLYAPHGLVNIGNSISLKQVTAHQIDVNNGASVIYETGLASLVFKNVLAGYAVTTWREIE